MMTGAFSAPPDITHSPCTSSTCLLPVMKTQDHAKERESETEKKLNLEKQKETIKPIVKCPS